VEDPDLHKSLQDAIDDLRRRLTIASDHERILLFEEAAQLTQRMLVAIRENRRNLPDDSDRGSPPTHQHG
jgi:hypothetical protein